MIKHLLKGFKQSFVLDFVIIQILNFDRKILIITVYAYQFQVSVIGFINYSNR